MATFLELLNSNFVCNIILVPILIFEVNFPIPPPPAAPGGDGGGVGVNFSTCFWGRGVVATFLELLSLNFVGNYHFGANFDF